MPTVEAVACDSQGSVEEIKMGLDVEEHSVRTLGSGKMCNFSLNHHMAVVMLSGGWESRNIHGVYILLIRNLCLV